MSPLLDLPADILLAVGDHVSALSRPFDHDPSVGLATHLALSRTCRHLRTFYTFDSLAAEDAFWRTACAAAGFGRPLRHDPDEEEDEEDAEPPLSWRELTLILVRHRDVCEIRSCKDASTWLSPHLSADAHSDYHDERPPPPPPSPLLVSIAPHAGTVAFHPLFYYLHFSPCDRALDPTSILLTHLPTVPGGRLQAYAPLAGHARASCAFATWPPVREISLVRPADDAHRHDEDDDEDSDEEDEDETVIASVCNPDGCTLLDLNRLLADTLPRTAENVHTVMTHYHTLLESYRAPDLSFAQVLRTGHHRGFMRDHSYPYLDDNPLPDTARDASKFTSSLSSSSSSGSLASMAMSSTEAIALRCSTGPRRASQAGFFVRDVFRS